MTVYGDILVRDLNSGVSVHRLPHWYDERDKPCDCDTKHKDFVAVAEAPSDGAYYLIHCDKCGRTYSRFMEG